MILRPHPAAAARFLAVALIVSKWLNAGVLMLVPALRMPTPGTPQELALSVGVRAAVACTVIWAVMRLAGEGLAALGLSGRFVRQALPRGLAVGVALFVVMNVLLATALSALGLAGGTAPALVALFRDPAQAPYWIFAGVVGGGLSEELQRAFVLTWSGRLLGRAGLVAALLVDSAAFGVGHLYQGPEGAVKAAVTGLVFGLVFLWRRRMADAMVAHAVFDLIGIAAAYALYGDRTAGMP